MKTCKHPEIAFWDKFKSSPPRGMCFKRNYYCLKCKRRLVHGKDKVFVLEKQHTKLDWSTVIDTRLKEQRDGVRDDVVVIKNV